ncbi:hypothetical protein DSUL_50205 [Desulfovibrionales bacterium]
MIKVSLKTATYCSHIAVYVVGNKLPGLTTMIYTQPRLAGR